MGYGAVQEEVARNKFTVTQSLSETELRARVQATTDVINMLKTYRKTLLKTYHDVSTQTITPEVTE